VPVSSLVTRRRVRVSPVATAGRRCPPDRPPAERFQLYDFETPPDYDRPERGGQAVDVTVTDGEGATVLDSTYRTSLPLTVQPRVTATPGANTLSASLADGASARHDWSLSTPVAPSWWALSPLVTNGGEPVGRTLSPNEAVGLPSGTVCRSFDEG
jgi:hypothetical protein